MSPFNYSKLLLLFCFVGIVISKTAVQKRICSSPQKSICSSPQNKTRSRLHGPVPPISQSSKQPKIIKNREGGSRLLARSNKNISNNRKLDRSAFLGLMGDDFKEPWMTYNEPKKPTISIPPDEIQNLTAIKGSWAATELEHDLERLNLTADLQKYAPELLPHEAQVRKYLMKRTSCPIEFTWKDLGTRYWPRWVRQGECKNREGFCSFPPGMACVPGVSTIVHLLHWQCKKKGVRKQRSVDYEERHFLEYKRPAPVELNSKGKTKIKDILNPPEMETSVLYRRRVPHLAKPVQIKKKKKKRFHWKKVPYLITIDCFCAC